MAYTLLPPQNNNKGILILKHLEVQYFTALDKKLIERLKKEYIIGVYFGFYSKLSKDIWWADFYLSADNVLKIKTTSVPRIPLNGFNFIDKNEISEVDNLDKKYDFLYIGNSQTRKNLLQFVKACKYLLERVESSNILIVNRLGNSIEEKLYVRRVRNVLQSMNSSTRKNITYIESMTSSNPLPKDVIKQFYLQSRTLVIPSRAEGAARVVGEASLNNLKVISYQKMQGGTNNHLNFEIDETFESFEQLPDIMEQTVRNRVCLSEYVSNNKSCYLEDVSKKVLIEHLVKLFFYERDNLEQQFSSQNFYNAFSSHLNLIKSEFTNNQTDEVLSFSKMYLYISYLTDVKPSFLHLIKARSSDAFSKLNRIFIFPKTLIKLIIS
ncbi:hypothetical protein ACMAZF_16330 [Psychrobium sp. nBUS_13]|uniref:hypothetical protein n=1 Tax=Psychrobium sp. nBUS_13 TaxID=3395319 RepID=UPI003EBF52CD